MRKKYFNQKKKSGGGEDIRTSSVLLDEVNVLNNEVNKFGNAIITQLFFNVLLHQRLWWLRLEMSEIPKELFFCKRKSRQNEL
jgi:hypothetical protein